MAERHEQLGPCEVQDDELSESRSIEGAPVASPPLKALAPIPDGASLAGQALQRSAAFCLFPVAGPRFQHQRLSPAIGIIARSLP